MKHFAIMANQAKDEGSRYSARLREQLEQLGCSVYMVPPILPWRIEEAAGDLERALVEAVAGIPQEVELVLVLGGDGTLLHAAKALAPRHLPVLGINLGNLGFLTYGEIGSMDAVLKRLVQEEYTLERRDLLAAGTGQVHIGYAMNDVVIARSGYSRLIHLQVFVDDELVSDYSSDGVIISTPTGSTGYSMSAGGPLVSPDVRVLLITPICPHSLHDRPLVVSASARIRIRLLPTFRSLKEEALITIDGNEYGKLSAGEHCEVAFSDEYATMIQLPDVTFWSGVRKKLQRSE